MNDDIKEYVKRCDKCQRINGKIAKSGATLHPVPVTPNVWHQVSVVYLIVQHHTLLHYLHYAVGWN